MTFSTKLLRVSKKPNRGSWDERRPFSWYSAWGDFSASCAPRAPLCHPCTDGHSVQPHSTQRRREALVLWPSRGWLQVLPPFLFGFHVTLWVACRYVNYTFYLLLHFLVGFFFDPQNPQDYQQPLGCRNSLSSMREQYLAKLAWAWWGGAWVCAFFPSLSNVSNPVTIETGHSWLHVLILLSF